VEFSKVSTFTSEEINDLYLFFNQLSKAQKDDGVIDYEEFRQAVSLKDGVYARNLFRIFDTNDDKVINFREFILAFATFLNETIDKQIRLSFKLYDPEDKGRVRRETMVAILSDALKSGGLGTLH
jgi:Ca2+-binding EF-hand superfamily protein